MTNDYYEVTTDFEPFTKGRSGQLDAELAAIESAFELLPSISQTQGGNPSFVAAGGTANAITVANPISTWASYTGKDGYKINIQITTVNTGAVTLAVDGLAAKTCKRNDGAALQAGDLAANGFYDFIYDESAGCFVVPEAINGVLTDATAQASAASSSASSASASASTATTQASNASSSASSASTSASTATTKASEASASATLASQWASNPEDDDVAGGEFSAKHYSIKAAASAAAAGGNIAAQIHAATAKTPLVDNDEFGIADSAAAYGLKKTLWSTIKSGIWTALGVLINGGTAKTTPADNDLFAIADSAASNASKKLTWANIKTTMIAALGEMASRNRATAAQIRGFTGDAGVTSERLASAAEPVTISGAADISLDWASFVSGTCQLTGNRSLSLSNVMPGTYKEILFYGNTSSTRTLTFSGSNWKGDLPAVAVTSSVKCLVGIRIVSATEWLVSAVEY